MKAFYNEIDAFCCAWLSNLMDKNLITPGEICDKSIADVEPNRLAGFNRCHFFAGIGLWDYAINLAGWGDYPVWTGSCPCQPFSQAGKGKGFDDGRHLWPEFYRLIKECRPPVCVGEQVASPDGLKWLDLVSADLEKADYATGAADLCAAGVGAPHIRQRIYWVAHSNDARLERRQILHQCGHQLSIGKSGMDGRMGYADKQRCDGKSILLLHKNQWGQNQNTETSGASTSGYAWANCEWIDCADGYARPVEAGTFPMDYGDSGRVGKLRAYGNAIVPQVAAEFIGAFLDCQP